MLAIAIGTALHCPPLVLYSLVPVGFAANAIGGSGGILREQFADLFAVREEQLKLLPFINALFSETSPIPIKAAMAKMGFCDNTLRLPLTEMDEAKAEKMYQIMRGHGLIG